MIGEHLDLLLGVNVTNPGILQVLLLDYVISLTASFPIKLSGTYLHHTYESGYRGAMSGPQVR
jgi:hypothetical protein